MSLATRSRRPVGARACDEPATAKKFTPEIDAALYDELLAVAKQNGQSQRYVLEQALGFYLRNVVPAQHLARTEVMRAGNRDLLERLGK
jgi:hypothetical protein